jgi:hypothetical protein
MKRPKTNKALPIQFLNLQALNRRQVFEKYRYKVGKIFPTKNNNRTES